MIGVISAHLVYFLQFKLSDNSSNGIKRILEKLLPWLKAIEKVFVWMQWFFPLSVSVQDHTNMWNVISAVIQYVIPNPRGHS